jgi:hypothetical protein
MYFEIISKIENLEASNDYWIEAMADNSTKQMFALCIENKDCNDLEKRKIYQILPDNEASKEGYMRVVDESGEDYLYPASYFIGIKLPHAALKALPWQSEMKSSLTT